MEADNIYALNLTRPVAKKIIAEIIATDQQRVIFTRHCKQRMREKKIDRLQVMRCLEHGQIIEGPYRDVHGNWQFNISTFSAGEPITVCAAFDRDDDGNLIAVITTYKN